eukprot:13345633-Alexandrium_andersonii.AAC.1
MYSSASSSLQRFAAVCSDHFAPEVLFGGVRVGGSPPRRGRAGNRCKPLQTAGKAAIHVLPRGQRGRQGGRQAAEPQALASGRA